MFIPLICLGVASVSHQRQSRRRNNNNRPFVFLLLRLVLFSLPSVTSLASSSVSIPRQQQQQQQQQSILLFGDSLTAGQVANRNGEFSPPGLRLRKLLHEEYGKRGEVSSSRTTTKPSVIVEGKPLESVRSMPARLETLLSRSSVSVENKEGFLFDTIVVMGGTNDLWKLNSEAIIQNLEKCFAVARKYNPNVRCGHVTLPPFTPSIVSCVSSVVSWFQHPGYMEKIEVCRKEANAAIARMAAAQAGKGAFLVDVAALCEEGKERGDDGSGDGDRIATTTSAPLSLPDGIHFDAPGYLAIGEEIFRSMKTNVAF